MLSYKLAIASEDMKGKTIDTSQYARHMMPNDVLDRRVVESGGGSAWASSWILWVEPATCTG
jgi:hypothetical protein